MIVVYSILCLCNLFQFLFDWEISEKVGNEERDGKIGIISIDKSSTNKKMVQRRRSTWIRWYRIADKNNLKRIIVQSLSKNFSVRILHYVTIG